MSTHTTLTNSIQEKYLDALKDVAIILKSISPVCSAEEMRALVVETQASLADAQRAYLDCLDAITKLRYHQIIT